MTERVLGKMGWVGMWVMAVAVVVAGARGGEVVNPYPREMLLGEEVHVFPTGRADAGVTVGGDAEMEVVDGVVRVVVTGEDPQVLLGGIPEVEGPLVLRMEVRATGGGLGEVFWMGAEDAGYGGERRAEFEVIYDDGWREYVVPVGGGGGVKGLRVDFASEPGRVEVRKMALHRGELHPLEVAEVRTLADRVEADLWNRGGRAVRFSYRDEGERELAPGGKATLVAVRDPGMALERVRFDVRAEGLPKLEREVWALEEGGKAADAAGGGGELAAGRGGVRVVALLGGGDGGLARMELGGRTVGYLAPVAAQAGRGWKVEKAGEWGLRWNWDGGWAEVEVGEGGVLRVEVEGDGEDVEGPVVRVLGGLEEAVFPGLEYLGKGEGSSTRLDIRTGKHLRYAPAVDEVAWPAVACVTGLASVVVVWENREVRPAFAAPNFVDGSGEHRISLRGKRVEAAVRVAESGAVTDGLLWAVRYRGLPELPVRPRGDAEQDALSLAGFSGALWDGKGWGHCMEARYERRPYATLASSVWRLSGKVPELGEVVRGGAHLEDDRIYYLTGRVGQWLEERRAEVRGIQAEQREDGGFTYEGEYREGSDEDTSSGYCGVKALSLLRYARATGDAGARDAGLRALGMVRRFRVPRGAQWWELSIHTPDVLAAAYLVEANVLGYEITGEEGYLEEAKRWALSGLPFVYLWGDKPVMRYATVPVFGASSWVAPLWIGKPVQWNGLVYAWALTRLAEHDGAPEWRVLAEGVLLAGEQMQIVEGEAKGVSGLLFLGTQRGGGPSISPSDLVIVGDAVRGRSAGLEVAVSGDGKRRVVAPFPVEIEGEEAVVRGVPPGLKGFQILVDGERVIEVGGEGGERRVPMGPADGGG